MPCQMEGKHKSTVEPEDAHRQESFCNSSDHPILPYSFPFPPVLSRLHGQFEGRHWARNHFRRFRSIYCTQGSIQIYVPTSQDLILDIRNSKRLRLDLFHHIVTSSDGSRQHPHHRRSPATAYQNRNVLDIRSYLSDIYYKKNANFSLIMLISRVFFVPLRPRNFTHWSFNSFSGYFLDLRQTVSRR